MIIESVIWGNSEQTKVIVNGVINVPWPCFTYHRKAIEKWLEGSEIGAYQPPVLTVSERRQKAYNDSGATVQEMTVALWEMIVEDRPQKANGIEVLRQQVKQQFPKEV